jgi:hypothetical protein
MWSEDPAADGEDEVEPPQAARASASTMVLRLAANAGRAKVGRIVDLSC